jgi:hypothetical protein
MISFSTGKLGKKLFWTNKNFDFFFKYSIRKKNLWKQFVKQIGEDFDEFVIHLDLSTKFANLITILIFFQFFLSIQEIHLSVPK